ncbi:MAG: hypothetical protein JWP78_2098 [Mucilaginibacter sp.]|nr:hypothetical protein [Mucilaginibacter sp.]
MIKLKTATGRCKRTFMFFKRSENTVKTRVAGGNFITEIYNT